MYRSRNVLRTNHWIFIFLHVLKNKYMENNYYDDLFDSRKFMKLEFERHLWILNSNLTLHNVIPK